MVILKVGWRRHAFITRCSHLKIGSTKNTWIPGDLEAKNTVAFWKRVKNTYYCSSKITSNLGDTFLSSAKPPISTVTWFEVCIFVYHGSSHSLGWNTCRQRVDASSLHLFRRASPFYPHHLIRVEYLWCEVLPYRHYPPSPAPLRNCCWPCL